MQIKNATTKKGSRNVMGAELCLAHDMGGWRHWGPPFGRHAALRLFDFCSLVLNCTSICESTFAIWAPAGRNKDIPDPHDCINAKLARTFQ